MRSHACEQQNEQAGSSVDAYDVRAGQRIIQRCLDKRARLGKRRTGKHAPKDTRHAHVRQHVHSHVRRVAHSVRNHVVRTNRRRPQRQTGEYHAGKRQKQDKQHDVKATSRTIRHRNRFESIPTHESTYSPYSASNRT